MQRTLFASIIALGACAAQPKQPQQPGAPGAQAGTTDEQVQCHEINDTGTLFSRTVCETRSDKQADQDDAQRNMKRAQMSPSPVQHGAGAH